MTDWVQKARDTGANHKIIVNGRYAVRLGEYFDLIVLFETRFEADLLRRYVGAKAVQDMETSELLRSSAVVKPIS